MNLVSFSLRTKGLHNFGRRLWTVFTRFGFSEYRTCRSLETITDVLQKYNSAPTFFIPAIVLDRHAPMIKAVAQRGAEIGIHGYVHNNYRALTKEVQQIQTQQAIEIFRSNQIAFQGFRNPYLSWNSDTVDIFASLNFSYESNEAVFHDVIDRDKLTSVQREGYEKSLKLYQALACDAYTLRPHVEEKVLRIPISIPDDEMLFDRLRLTDVKEVGLSWSKIMQGVHRYGGVYALNLHPERAVLCKDALDQLLAYACTLAPTVWLTRLADISAWWKEHSQFRLKVTAIEQGRWCVQATCSPRATILARNVTVEDQPTAFWSEADTCVQWTRNQFTVYATRCPCIGLSLETGQDVEDFLYEQGYAVMRTSQEHAGQYAIYLDMPEGMGKTRDEQLPLRCSLVKHIEALDAPLVRFGNWPDAHGAALAVTGDIDAITVQDFFLRIVEVSRNK